MKWKQYSLSLVWTAVVFAMVMILLFFILRVLGHILTIGSIRPTSLQLVRYSRTKKYTISISSIHLKPHLPKPTEPYWAKFFAQNYQYRDAKNSVSISAIEGTLWFFPMLFRFTSGPLLTIKFDDFRVQVYNSRQTPRWIPKLRDNLIYTMINEETVRLHQFNSQFGVDTSIETARISNEFDEVVEQPRTETDEVKVQAKAQQWHIHNATNNRMYTFHVLEAELRKNWAEERGTFVMIAHDSKWTKLPLLEQRRDTTTLRYVFQALLQLPKELRKFVNDPLSIIDVDCSRCDITFNKFHVRDGSLFEQINTLIQSNYEPSRDHGILSDIGINNLIRAMTSLYGDQPN